MGTDLPVPEPPQAVCIARHKASSDSSANGNSICWVDRKGHLRTQKDDGEWGDIFVGDDIAACIVNLSKNSNMWGEIGRQEDADADEEQGEAKKKGKKRAASASAVVPGSDQ